MREILKKQVVRYLLSAILYGAIYSLISWAHKGYVEIFTVLCSTVGYSVVMLLLYFIAPKLRKITGHDKDNG